MLDQNKENQLNNWLEQSVLNNRIPFGEINISKEYIASLNIEHK